jgi:hypothetical protein
MRHGERANAEPLYRADHQTPVDQWIDGASQ